MICPSKLCKEEIPDNSLYCDMCGIRILKCSKCGSIGISNFCKKCGGKMGVDYEYSLESVSSIQINQTHVQNNSFQSVSSDTQIVQIESSEKSLQLYSSNGIVLNVKDGNILGRTIGDFVQQLGTFSVISSRHAQISKKDGKWFITDLHSTNKTFINNIQLTPNIPTEIKKDDVIILANVSFVARFK